MRIQPYFMGCGGEANSTVTVQTSPVTPSDGIQVNLRSSLGELAETRGVTTNGQFTTSVRVPATKMGDRGEVRASALGMEGSFDRNVSCIEDPPLLRTFTTTCADRATSTFEWFPVIGATQHWIDLSLFDNGFADGT